jgi:hypothetical protein
LTPENTKITESLASYDLSKTKNSPLLIQIKKPIDIMTSSAKYSINSLSFAKKLKTKRLSQ